MSEKFENNEQPEEGGINPTPENRPESQEKMVEAIKISTVFSDEKVLQEIADRLLAEGTISGFHIDKTSSGYIAKGKKVKEGQYSLEILLEASAGDEVKRKIREAVAETIGKKWEVPAIEEENVHINERLLSFIKRAEVEHRRFIAEKKTKWAIALVGLLSISTTLAMLGEKYVRHREQRIVRVEQKKAHDKILALINKVDEQITQIETNEMVGKHLTPSPNTEMGGTYEETEKVLQTMWEVEREMDEFAKQD